LRVRAPALKKRLPSTQTPITGITCGAPFGRTVANEYVAVDSSKCTRGAAHGVGVVTHHGVWVVAPGTMRSTNAGS
jgi:hypothetical protein